MIQFIIKGLIRDRSRSIFPVLVVTAGVALTVLIYCWVKGAENEMIRANAHFTTGHVKIMSRAYAAESDQIPNDLALAGIDTLLPALKQRFPELVWTPRIRFGGLLDIPDEQGETRDQGPVMGMAIDLFSPESPEKQLLNLEPALVSGRLPREPGEMLISETFAQSLNVKCGDRATLISSTMFGSMTMANFAIVGTIRFGVTAMDRGSMVADIGDIQRVLDMQGATGEILGFFNNFVYNKDEAQKVADAFNQRYSDEADEADEFSPIMKTLRQQSGLAELLDMTAGVYTGLTFLFVVVMSLVLWNAGLMGGLRRYGEFGVRLAFGERKGHLYRSLLLEALVIGLCGSIFGSALGLALSYYLQNVGIDISGMMKNAAMVMSNVMRARVTPVSYVIGFIPGVIATLIGAAIAGIGIYRRQTSQLFKELEV